MSKIIITRKPIKALTKPSEPIAPEKKRAKKATVTFDNEDGQSTTTETVKDLSSRWGRAAKFIVKGLPPTIPGFAPLWEKGLSSEDPYYDIICREISYGMFPENMYFDHHRGVVILSKYVKKKITKKSAKNTSADFVCTTLFGDTIERTTMARNTATATANKQAYTTTNNNDEGSTEEELEMAREHELDQKILDIVNRGTSRGEFLLRELVEAGISHHQLYMELKYYLYKVAGILSPIDANKLRQKEEMKNKLLKEVDENSQVSWKKLHNVEKERYWWKYIHRKCPGISRLKMKFLMSWLNVVFLKGDYEIKFENKEIVDVPGLELDEQGNIVQFNSENRAKKVFKDYEFVLGKYNGFQMNKFWFKDSEGVLPTSNEELVIE